MLCFCYSLTNSTFIISTLGILIVPVSSHNLGNSLIIAINYSVRSGLSANTCTPLLATFSSRLVDILIPKEYGLSGVNVMESALIGRAPP